jgi:hypothetical protein
MKSAKKFFLSFVMVTFVSSAILFPAQEAKADATREFLMSVTYGTLAGALLGTASLAFKDHPADNLQTIARGASLGLYFGILLGVYVIYGVSDDKDQLDNILPPEDDYGFRIRNPIVYPTLSDSGKFNGAAVQLTVYKF